MLEITYRISMSILPAVFTLVSFSAHADIVDTRQAAGTLNPDTIYAVEYNCQNKKNAASYLRSISKRPFKVYKGAVTGFVISGKSPNASIDEKLTTTGVDQSVAVLTRSVVTRGNALEDFNNLCNGYVFVAGGKPLHLTAFLNTTTDPSTPALDATATLATSTISPLFTLITGSPLATAVGTKITNTNSILSSFKTFLNAFKGTQKETNVVSLMPGITFIKTGVGDVRIRVRPITSLLLDGSTSFRDDYAGIITSQPKLDKTKIDDTCASLANSTFASKISSIDDVSYIMYLAAISAGFNKEEIIRCLTYDRAQSAVRNMRLYRVAPESKISSEDIKSSLDSEEEMIKKRLKDKLNREIVENIKNNMILFIPAAVRYIDTGFVNESDARRFGDIVITPVVMEDDTTDGSVLDLSSPSRVVEGSLTEILDNFRIKGFSKMGCWIAIENLDEFRPGFGNASIMMLASTARNADDRDGNKVIGIRITFEADKVKKLYLTDSWVPELVKRHGSCTLTKL